MIFIITISLIIALILTIFSLPRVKIPRDSSQEGADNNQSDLAYDKVSRGLLFDLIRFYFIQKLKKLNPRGKLLDAGCGPGYLAINLALQFPNLEVIGVDLSPNMIYLAAKNLARRNLPNRVEFIQADIQQIQLKDPNLDFVISTLSLHHWVDPRQALLEFYRTLKPDGRILIFDLRRDMPWTLFWLVNIVQKLWAPAAIRQVNGGMGSIWSSYTPKEIEGLLSQTPFKDWRVERGWGWLYIHGIK